MSIYSTRLGETIGEVKLMIERYDGIPVGMQHLRYRGMPLSDDARTLRSYNITGGAVDIVCVLHGSMLARPLQLR